MWKVIDQLTVMFLQDRVHEIIHVNLVPASDISLRFLCSIMNLERVLLEPHPMFMLQ
jgi:hypothetical protein